MARKPTVLAVTLVLGLLAAAGAAASVAASGDRMTICHKPQDPNVNRTMEIPRSAWSGHRGHGDHEGACGQGAPGDGSGRTGSSGKTGAPPPPPPMAALSLRAQGDGALDGDAWFRVTLSNDDPDAAYEVHLTGNLRGDGHWRVRAEDGWQCTIARERLDCRAAALGGDGQTWVRLDFDASLGEVCDQAGIDLSVSARNDGSSGDDRVDRSVWIGACAPLGPPPA